VDMSEEELDAVDVDALTSRILRLGNELDQVSCRAAASLSQPCSAHLYP
jgi:16S rRNA G527 N7-methylase RsmG